MTFPFSSQFPADRVRYVPLFQEKAALLARDGLRCFQEPIKQLARTAIRDRMAVVAHIEDGLAYVLLPLALGSDVATVEAAARAAADRILERTGGRPGQVNITPSSYDVYSRDRWLDGPEHAAIRDGVAIVGMLDFEWLQRWLAACGARNGLRCVPEVGEARSGVIRFVREEAVPLTEHASLQLFVDVRPLEHLEQRIAELAALEPKLAAWARDAAAAGLRPVPPSRRAEIDGRHLARWRRTAEDHDLRRSPQVVLTGALVDWVHGVEPVVDAYCSTKLPGGRFFLGAKGGGRLIMDLKKGLEVLFDHELTTLDERLATMRLLIDLAKVFRACEVAAGRPLRALTEGRAHWRYLRADLETYAAQVDRIGFLLPEAAGAG